MNMVGDIERITQNRVVSLLKDQLKYKYLGNWEERPNNSNIEEKQLTQYLRSKKQNIVNQKTEFIQPFLSTI